MTFLLAPFRTVLGPAVLLLATLGLAPVGAAQGPGRIETVEVVKQRLEPRFEVLGEARAVRTVDVGTEVEGLVSKLEVDEGQSVGANAPLLALETTQREIALRAAKARLETAKQQLSEYERGSRPEEIAEARAERERAKALVVEAEDELERIRSLLKDEVASERDLMRAEAIADSRRAELAAAKAKLERVETGPRIEVIARAKARIDEVQAEVDRIEDELKKARVLAPFPGSVAEKFVERGAYVRVGDRILTLVQLDPIEITFAVPERLFARMPRDLPLEIAFDAYPGQKFEGRIHRIVPIADPLARTIPVRVRLENPEHRLLPGMVARALVPTPTDGEVLTVPWDAIVRTPRGRIVYKIVEGRAQPVPVEVGARQDNLVEVRGPLAVGDVVATRGNERLQPNQEVIVNQGPQGGPQGGPPPEGEQGGPPQGAGENHGGK